MKYHPRIFWSNELDHNSFWPDARIVAIWRITSRLITGNGTVLDFGCGIGQLRRYLIEKFKHYYGADICDFERHYPAGEYLFLNEIIELPSGSVDCFIAIDSLQFIENYEYSYWVKEIKRVCSPTCQFVIVDRVILPERFQRISTIRDYAEDLGFKIIRQQKIGCIESASHLFTFGVQHGNC